MLWTYSQYVIMYPDFYTAWDVIAKHVLEYSSDPVLAQRYRHVTIN